MKRTEQMKLSDKNQFALGEIHHFAECVLENRQPHTTGEEGLQDHRIMEAIYEAARDRQNHQAFKPNQKR